MENKLSGYEKVKYTILLELGNSRQEKGTF